MLAREKAQTLFPKDISGQGSPAIVTFFAVGQAGYSTFGLDFKIFCVV